MAYNVFAPDKWARNVRIGTLKDGCKHSRGNTVNVPGDIILSSLGSTEIAAGHVERGEYEIIKCIIYYSVTLKKVSDQ